MYVLGFICYPIALLLDYLLGEHDITRYKNDQLKALVNLHSKNTLEQMNYDMNGEVGLSVV
jgi:metal transporter CNNM